MFSEKRIKPFIEKIYLQLTSFEKHPKDKISFKSKMAISLIIFAFCVIAFYNGLVIRNYTINTDKFNPGESIRAVLISDLHSHIFGENQIKLISKIKKQNPDIIFLAGDIIDDEAPPDGAKLLFDGIKSIAPIFYVSGNHDYWTNDIKNIKQLVRSYGITVLEYDYKEININGIPVVIAGIDDPDWVYYEKNSSGKSMDENFQELTLKNQFKILVAHRPEQIESYKKYPFDLVVSGHTHGGQVRIPFLLNGLMAPNQGWFPKYAGGMYKHGSLTHIVSRGASFYLLLPRVFNPPEIVVIDISARSQTQKQE